MTSSLPLAIGIAASPFAILPVLLVLLGPRARTAGPAFAAGWILGVATVATVLGQAAFFADAADKPRWAAFLRIGVGVALLLMAARKWRRRGAAKPAPRWMTALGEAGPKGAAGIGLMLTTANPKVLMLAGAGGATIGAQAPSLAAEWAWTAVFVLVSSATVAGPVAVTLIAGDRVAPALTAIQAWVMPRTALLLAAVTGVIGAAVLAGGVLTIAG